MIREHLRKRGIRAVIPVPADQQDHRLRRGSLGGRAGHRSSTRKAHKQLNTARHRHPYGKTATIYLAGSTSQASSSGPPADPDETA
jgi:hypothetical protein